ESDAVGGSIGNADTCEVEAAVAVLIRQPNIRRPAGEETDAASDLLPRCTALAEIPVESDPGRKHLRRGGDIGTVPVGVDGEWIGAGGFRKNGDIETHPVGESEIGLGAPHITSVNPELMDRELRRLIRVR